MSTRLPLSIDTDAIWSQTIPYHVLLTLGSEKVDSPGSDVASDGCGSDLGGAGMEIEFQNSPSTVGGAV